MKKRLSDVSVEFFKRHVFVEVDEGERGERKKRFLIGVDGERLRAAFVFMREFAGE